MLWHVLVQLQTRDWLEPAHVQLHTCFAFPCTWFSVKNHLGFALHAFHVMSKHCHNHHHTDNCKRVTTK